MVEEELAHLFKAKPKPKDLVRMKKIIAILKKTYPDSHCSLKYETPFQLLVATVLSAQCTDHRVNLVTSVLFAKYPDARAMARASVPEIEKLVRTTGFYKNKALALKELSQAIVYNHNGKVPETMFELTRLRGVGRKTANVVMGNAFGKNTGVVVDTHVGRITRRLGFTSHKDPEKVEEDLVVLIPKRDWTLFSHLLIDHGRAICTARTNPACDRCPLFELCVTRGAGPR